MPQPKSPPLLGWYLGNSDKLWLVYNKTDVSSSSSKIDVAQSATSTSCEISYVCGIV